MSGESDDTLSNAFRKLSLNFLVALICGAAPLFVGVSIFLLWFFTRWDWLELAGILTLYVGVVVVLFGGLMLALFCWRAIRTGAYPRRRVWFSTFGAGALLLSNFLVAAGIIAAVIALETCFMVIIRNASQNAFDDVRVFGGGCDLNFGTIPPGGVIRRSFWIQHDGQLELSVASGPTTQTTVIEGYVSHGIGGRATVTINPNGTISVTEKAVRRND